jgi:nucleotide-binding universal stress UspA family protein
VLRSILVALDETGPSQAAQDLAVDLVKRTRADVTGLAVLDRDHITAATAVGIGGSAFKQHRDEVKLREARTLLARLEQTFEAACKSLNTKYQVLEAEGNPYELLEEEAGRHDLVVIGKDTDFHLDDDPSIADITRRLLRDTPRPLIVCPEKAPTEGLILATTDGSVRASRALHMLALLGRDWGRPVHVLAIAEEKKEAERRARYAGELFDKHGFEVEAHGVNSYAAPADIILAEVQDMGATMVAAGASGHGALHEFFVGSTTRRLLETCLCPLFVFH